MRGRPTARRPPNGETLDTSCLGGSALFATRAAAAPLPHFDARSSGMSGAYGAQAAAYDAQRNPGFVVDGGLERVACAQRTDECGDARFVRGADLVIDLDGSINLGGLLDRDVGWVGVGG